MTLCSLPGQTRTPGRKATYSSQALEPPNAQRTSKPQSKPDFECDYTGFTGNDLPGRGAYVEAKPISLPCERQLRRAKSRYAWCVMKTGMATRCGVSKCVQSAPAVCLSTQTST